MNTDSCTVAVSLPTLSAEGLIVPVALVNALLPFVSQDPFGIGFEDCCLAATDGHTGARFLGVDPGGMVPTQYDRSLWTLEHVTRLVKIAKVDKAPSILLRWDARSETQFPPLSKALPTTREVKPSDWGINPDLMARVAKAAAALKTKRAAVIGARLVNSPGAGGSDPYLYELQSEPRMEIAIMPLRI